MKKNTAKNQTPAVPAIKLSPLAKEFRLAYATGTPIVTVSTPDNPATMNELIEALNGRISNDAAEHNNGERVALFQWDAMRAMQPMNAAAETVVRIFTQDRLQDLSRSPYEFLDITASGICENVPNAQKSLGCERLSAVVFAHNLHRYMLGFGQNSDPSSITTTQGVANLREIMKPTGSMLVILGDDVKLGGEVAADVLALDQPLPTDAQLAAIFTEIFEPVAGEPDAKTVAAVVNALRGCTAFSAEQITAMNVTTKGTVNIDGMWKMKRAYLNAQPGLSVYDGDASIDDVGGCQGVKTYLSRLLNGNAAPEVIVWVDEIEKAFSAGSLSGDNTGTSQDFLGETLTFMQDNKIPGSIFLGPPGTAKSEVSKAAGALKGIPVVRLDVGSMKTSLLGASGANLRKAYKVIQAISGGRALFIATSNGINSLPTELLRRFKLPTFFFELPDATERAAIWEIWLRKFELTDEITFDDAGWTGAEIQACCETAWRLSISVAEAADYIIPSGIKNRANIEALCQDANGKYLSASTGKRYEFCGLPQPGKAVSAAEAAEAPASRRRRLLDE